MNDLQIKTIQTYEYHKRVIGARVKLFSWNQSFQTKLFSETE